jgi:DNA-binding transcriptional LysR family regulator
VPNRVCLDALAARAGITPRISYETADYALTLALVRAGLGIALVPAMVLGAHPGIQARELDGDRPARQISTVHRKRPSPLVTEIVTLLSEAAQQHGDTNRHVSPRIQQPFQDDGLAIR